MNFTMLKNFTINFGIRTLTMTVIKPKTSLLDSNYIKTKYNYKLDNKFFSSF